MQDSIQHQILRALLQFLRPVARLLLKVGIGYREFAEVSKAAFVDVATSDYGLRGRPTNISRVAVMTGLTRKEVRRLRDKAAAGEETVVLRSAPMSVILHNWYSDNQFTGKDGGPLKLSFDGKSPNFTDLVRKHGGDIPPGAMRTELKRIDAIDEAADGTLTVKKRNVSGLEAHEKLITGFASILYPAAQTIIHNMDQERNGETWIQRRAWTNMIRPSDLPRIRRVSADRLVDFTESVDDLFSAYETLYEADKGSEESDTTVGVCVFYYELANEDLDVVAG